MRFSRSDACRLDMSQEYYSIVKSATFLKHLILIMVIGSLSGCGGLAKPETNPLIPIPTPNAPASGTILFTRECAIPGIYAIEANGSNERQVIEKDGSREASWSPDGKHIAFQALTCCTEQATSDVYILDTTESTEVKLTNGQHPYNSPSWSPDGENIAFSNGSVYTMGLNDFAPKRLHPGVAPAWSPD